MFEYTYKAMDNTSHNHERIYPEDRLSKKRSGIVVLKLFYSGQRARFH